MVPSQKIRDSSILRRQMTCNHQRRKKPKAVIGPSTHRKNLVGIKSKDKTIIEEWIYRFLGNLATVEADKLRSRKRKPAIRFSKLKCKSKKNRHRRFRSPTPYSWDRDAPKSLVKLLQHPIDVDENDNGLPMVPKAQCCNVIPYQTRSVRVNAKRKKSQLQDCLLLEKINGYIKADIAGGKRRAKTYIRKALAYALESGYLMPADREGKFLRVLPVLIHQVKSVAASYVKKQRRICGGRQSIKMRTTSAPKIEKRKSVSRKRSSETRDENDDVDKDKVDDKDDDDDNDDDDDDDSVESNQAEEEDKQQSKKVDSERIAENIRPRRLASIERQGRDTLSDSTSEESKENSKKNVSKKSSRNSSQGKIIEESAKVSIRSRSADLNRKPMTICAKQCTRPLSANQLMDLEMNVTNSLHEM